MKISLNKIEFDVTPVGEDLRAMLLADPIIAQGVTRDVWHWDQPTLKGAVLVPLTRDRAVPLPNGICFFVSKPGANGVIQKAEVPTLKMSARFLEVLGGKSMIEVMQALNRIVNLPQKTIPVESFHWLRPYASFKVVQHIEYAVVELANTARNLSAFFLVPGQVYYSYQITEMVNRAGYDAAQALDPKQATNRPGFIVPASTKANDAIRRVALAQRINEIRQDLAGVHPNDLAAEDARRGLIARLGIEWNALTAAARKTARA
jgi:hypothetical protein